MACWVDSCGAATIDAADQATTEVAVERGKEGHTWKRMKIGTGEMGWNVASDGAAWDWQLGVRSW